MEKIGLFLGTRRGYHVLEALLQAKKNIAHVLVLTQQPHELSIYTDKIIKLCEENKISYQTSEQVDSKKYHSYLEEKSCDILFVVSWRFLIPENCFTIPTYGIFVLHDSLLPKYRGFSPTNWVIINGEKETGLTLQYINREMDAGDIVDQLKVTISDNETAKTLDEKLLPLYPKIILKNIDALLDGTNKRIKQINDVATFGCKRTPEDGHIDMYKSTAEIVRLIRGLTFPYPGAYCYYNGVKIIICNAEVVENPQIYVGRIPGRIIAITDSYVDVLTGDGILRILEISNDGVTMTEPKNTFRYISKKLE